MAQNTTFDNYTILLPENKREEFLVWFKQQIKDAYNQGYRDGEGISGGYSIEDISEFSDAEIYFNDNFK